MWKKVTAQCLWGKDEVAELKHVLRNGSLQKWEQRGRGEGDSSERQTIAALQS